MTNRIVRPLAVCLLACTWTTTANAQSSWAEFQRMCAAQGMDARAGTATNPPACVPRSGGGGRAGVDAADAARRAEAARVAAEAERVRLAEEKRLQDIADFEYARDAAAATFKGTIGTVAVANGGDAPAFRGTVDTGIRTGRPGLVDRDFSGPQAAWKELHCAASILQSAIARLDIDDLGGVGGDLAGFNNLTAEAANAMVGQVRGIPCASAAAFPRLSGKYSDPNEVAAAGKRLVARIAVQGRALNEARDAEAAAKTPEQLIVAKARTSAARLKLQKSKNDLAKAKVDPGYYAVVFDEGGL